MSDATASGPRVFPPAEDFSNQAHIGSMAQYEQMYRRSIEDPAAPIMSLYTSHLGTAP